MIATVATLSLFRTRELAYGPYLSGGALIVLFAWRSYFAQGERWFALGPLMLVQAGVMVILLVASLLLVRTIRRLLGFQDFDDELEFGEWTSGDQLAFFANKDYESGRGVIHSPDWPGRAAGQGRQHVDQWRSGGR